MAPSRRACSVRHRRVIWPIRIGSTQSAGENVRPSDATPTAPSRFCRHCCSDLALPELHLKAGANFSTEITDTLWIELCGRLRENCHCVSPLRRLLHLFVVVALIWPMVARAQIDADAFRADLRSLAAAPARVIGSPGYYAAADYLAREIEKLPNVELKVHEFDVMMPVTESATLDCGEGRVEKVYPFWPAQVRLCATPAEGISGRLVYVGECRYEQIRPASLSGQIAVVEASAGENWVQAFYFGARSVIVLGKPDTAWPELQSHELRIPINLPRFFVPAGKLADDLRQGAVDHATLKASVSWQRRRARNLYALVRPAKPTPDGWTQSHPPAALMFSASFDSSSLVPDLSPGASQCTQAACGLALLRALSAHTWNRPVVVFFSGADSVQFLGTRNMFLALAESPATW